VKDNFLLSRGVRVKEERMRLSLTQQQCADACGVSRVQWGKYERDVNGLDGEVLKRFIAIGADGAYILGGVRGGTEHERKQFNAMLNTADLVADENERLKIVELGLRALRENTDVFEKRKSLYDDLLTFFNTFDDETMERVRLNIVDVYHANLNRKNLN
jgi:transcriptional regulator with XRE-family HTH domain